MYLVTKGRVIPFIEKFHKSSNGCETDHVHLELQREVGAVEIQAQPVRLLRSHGSSSWAGLKEARISVAMRKCCNV